MNRRTGNPNETWDSVSEVYDELYKSAWSRSEDDIVGQKLRRFIGWSEELEVLDVGCGTGLGYNLIRSCTARLQYIGLDRSAGMLAKLKTKYPGAMTVLDDAANVRQIFRRERFDVVLGLNATMSYCGNIDVMLRSIHEIVKPGGLVFLSYLNRLALRRLVRCKFEACEMFLTRGASDELGVVPAVTVTPSDIQRALSRSGFREVVVSPQSILGGVWESAFSLRLEPELRRAVPWLGHTLNVLGRRY